MTDKFNIKTYWYKENPIYLGKKNIMLLENDTIELNFEIKKENLKECNLSTDWVLKYFKIEFKIKTIESVEDYGVSYRNLEKEHICYKNGKLKIDKREDGIIILKSKVKELIVKYILSHINNFNEYDNNIIINNKKVYDIIDIWESVNTKSTLRYDKKISDMVKDIKISIIELDKIDKIINLS